MKRMDRKIVGVDEVGRGALAGPVVVVAVALADRTLLIPHRQSWGLRDSKQLTARQREAWYAHIMDQPGISFAVACVHPRQIEKLNISRAANVAALRAYRRVVAKREAPITTPVFLDGGLYLANSRWQTANVPNAKTIIKGDEKITAVAIASIIAKVHRDRLMRQLGKKYPEYGFEAHKGYGTKRHYAALKKWGVSDVHRLTFLGKRPTIRK